MSGGEKVLLMELRERTSAAGNRYLSGWLGKAAVVAFLDRDAAEPTWQVFVSTPQPRGDANSASTGSRSPFTSRPHQSSRRKASPQRGELDDDLPDF